MNNVNKPMTASQSEENVGPDEGSDLATPGFLELAESNMDMAIYKKDGWEDSHMQRKDALEAGEATKPDEPQKDGYEVANGFKPGFGGGM